MKNYQIEAKDGTKHWISRSSAVCAIIVGVKELSDVDMPKNEHILAVKRGKGSSTFPGLWCCPCGYLDRGERIVEACARELKEETNLDIPIENLRLIDIEDDPKAFNENITFRFFSMIPYDSEFSIGTTGEKDEIEEVKWIPFEDIDEYEWAFNHNNYLKNLF